MEKNELNEITRERKLSLGDEVWGAKMFLYSIRNRLKTRKVFDSLEMRACVPDRDFTLLPIGWNIAILGPTGAGKSSCIYTFWRAINGISENNDEISVRLKNLHVGWSVSDIEKDSERNQPEAQHGTRSVSSFIVREASNECAQILIQDTMGQQFYDEKESKYLNELVEGTLKDGSTLEELNLRYWLNIGSIQFLKITSLETSPHVLLLVFDASLNSLNKILNVNFDDLEWENKVPQLSCYHQVLDRAKKSELDVYICLTHIDVYEKKKKLEKKLNSENNTEENDENKRVGEDVQDELDELIEKLSRSLSYGERHLPTSHIFVMENYRKGMNTSNPRIDLAAVELLDALINSADEYIGIHCPKKNSCILS